MNASNRPRALATAFVLESSAQPSQTYQWLRLRFETKQIAPADLPNFRYVASVLGHNAIHYTVLIPESNLQQAIMQVKVAWSDAVIHAAEVSDGEFGAHDLALKVQVYGVASQSVVDARPGAFARFKRWLAGDAKEIQALREVHESNLQHTTM